MHVTSKGLSYVTKSTIEIIYELYDKSYTYEYPSVLLYITSLSTCYTNKRFSSLQISPFLFTLYPSILKGKMLKAWKYNMIHYVQHTLELRVWDNNH